MLPLDAHNDIKWYFSETSIKNLIYLYFYAASIEKIFRKGEGV